MTGSYTHPSRGDVHVNRPLTNISVAFLQSEEAFVAMQVFPNIDVQYKSDMYFVYDRSDFNRDSMKKRAPGTESAGAAFGITEQTYTADVFSLHRDIPDQVVANMDNPLNAQRDSTIFLTQQGLLRREVDWRDQYFTAGGNPGAIWTFVADGVASGSATAPGSYNPADVTDVANKITKWSDYSASTPIEDVRRAKQFMQMRTGYRPNIMTFGRPAYDTLLDHPDLIGRFDRGQTTGAALANRQTLAQIFELDAVYVMDGIINTAAEGLVEVNSFIGGNHALLSYRPNTPGIMIPSAGYTFSWTGYLGAGNRGTRMKSFYMQHLESERVEISMAFTHNKVSKDLGFFFDTII